MVRYLVWSAILLAVMFLIALVLRTRAWTPEGLQLAFGNREKLPAADSLAGRADRAANNMLEWMVVFTALVAAAHFAGRPTSSAQTGAALFFWARLVYWPAYLAGIVYLRTAIWFVSFVGLIMIAASVW